MTVTELGDAQWVPQPGAHYLRPSKGTRVPRRYVFFDTEAHRAKRGPVETQTWRCGATYALRWSKSTNRWSDPEIGAHSEPEGLWRTITGWARKDSRTVVVAHNLAYDLRIAKAFEVLPALGWKLGRPVLAGDHVSVDAECEGRKLCFVDSRTYLPHSLEVIAARLGMTKPALPGEDDAPAIWAARCRADVEILAAAYMAIVDWLLDQDLGNWGRTGPATGWSVMLRSFLTDKVLVHARADVRDLEAKAMYAGRAETWRWGKLHGGPWHVWDYANAYAEVCRDVALPAILRGEVRGAQVKTFERYTGQYCYLAEATVTLDRPALPCADANGVFWPVGTVQGWWWDVELLLAAKLGARVKVHRAWKYTAAPWLASWGDWVVGQVGAQATGVDRIRATAAKHWARSVIGRSSMRFWDFHSWGDAYVPGAGYAPITNMDSGAEGAMVTMGGQRWEAWERTWWEQALPQLLSYVMAVSRVRLWDAMEVAGFDNVVWCHTDCVVVSPLGHERLLAATSKGELGSLRYKSEQKSFTPMTPYLVDGSTYRVRAGVPRKTWQDSAGNEVGERWESLEKALATGHTSAVLVVEAIFSPDLTDTRRVHLPDGSTAAYTVSNGVRDPAIAATAC